MNKKTIITGFFLTPPAMLLTGLIGILLLPAEHSLASSLYYSGLLISVLEIPLLAIGWCLFALLPHT